LQKRLRIAIVLERFLPSTGGQNYFSGLVKELAKRGHDVHVFATEIEETPGPHYTMHLIPAFRYPRSLRLISFVLNSARVINRYDFDIIHEVMESLTMNVFNPHGGVEKAYLIQEFASINNRMYYFLRLIKRYLSLRHYIALWIQKKQFQMRRAKKIIAISTMVKNDMIQYYKVPEEKIEVVFNCVDTNRFHPRNRDIYRRSVRTLLKIDDNVVILLFAGHNYRLKGLESLLGAVSVLKERVPHPSLHLLITGRGQIARYKRIARRLGVLDLTTFLGPVKDIEQFYGASDIYVHPTFYDSCSLTVLEALASGIPVITTRFNGAADVIISDEGGKVLHDPKDVKTLAEAIAVFLGREGREKARRITRQWVEKYTPEYNAEKTLEVYYKVLEEADRNVNPH
jgi:UDP-glucose:(heptosyl)LPS alpha-1,3-glucosyltransferase